MPKLHRLKTDFSPFFLRKDLDRTKIPGGVYIVLGDGQRLNECAGLMLARHSVVLLNMMMKDSTIVLETEFVDRTSVEDCIDLLYGGQVELNSKNSLVIAKFGQKYEVPSMVDMCTEWSASGGMMDTLKKEFPRPQRKEK